LRTRRPSIAPQTEVATTATAESPSFPTWETPAILRDSVSSKLATLPPMTGHRASSAYFISGTRKSIPNIAVPLTFDGVSKRAMRLPISLYSEDFFRGGSLGTDIAAAFVASEPYVSLLPDAV